MTDNIKLQCRKCETVFVAVELPIDVMKLVKKVKQSCCPNCFESASKSNIYTGGNNGEKDRG